jgi:hypothetical protein
MLHSVFAASALTMVMAATFPFMSGTEAENASIVAAGSNSGVPLISAEESRGDSHDSTVALLEFVQHHTATESGSGDDEGSANGSDSSDSSGSNAEGSTGGGTSSDGTTSGGTSGGASGGGTAAGGTTPSPSPPPPPPPAPVCPAAIGGSTPGAPSRTSPLGASGTTSDDLQSFAQTLNAIRVANCLPPVPFGNIRYDSCMEDRLFWMAEDPSTDPMSAWGHIGSVRSDGLASVGCDGNLAGGTGNTGSTVAQKWWDSSSHRDSLYKPTYTSSTSGVCILFAMTHGGVPNEPYSFTRAAARWVTC